MFCKEASVLAEGGGENAAVEDSSGEEVDCFDAFAVAEADGVLDVVREIDADADED